MTTNHDEKQDMKIPPTLTLCDYFAALSMQGHRASMVLRLAGNEVIIPPADEMAQWAYRDADAMLKERADREARHKAK